MDVMFSQLEELKTLQIGGIVFGVLKKDYSLDIEKIKEVAAAALPLPVTLHKCIDLVPDLEAAILELKKIPNLKYILTSGQQATAQKGISTLLRMKKLAAPKIKIIAAGKITKGNLESLHEELELEYYHGRRIVS